VTSVPGSRDEALTDDIIEAAVRFDFERGPYLDVFGSYERWREQNPRAFDYCASEMRDLLAAAVVPLLRARERVRSADDVDAIADRLEYNRPLHQQVINAYRHAADVLRGGVARGGDHA
jgi:hypothetical protein